MSRLPLCFLLLAASACASQKLQPMTVSSAYSAGYALEYPDSLRAAADSFASHKQQAYELSSKLASGAPKPKPGEDPFLLLHVVEQADADGRREQNVQARRADRELRAFWEAERGHIGARVANAAQKQVTEGGCNEVQTQAAVNQALRDAVTRQLDKRTQKASEAQRYLEQIKGRISAATWNAAERSADDITLASYLVYVALVDDVLELQRLRDEYNTVVATLQYVQNQERAAASGKLSGKEAEASEKRQQLIATKLTATQNERVTLDRALHDYEQQLKQVRATYEQALAGAKAALVPPPQPQAKTAAPAR